MWIGNMLYTAQHSTAQHSTAQHGETGLTVSFHHALRMKRAQVIIVSEMDDRRI
jgi:hypothetical protein